MPNSAPGSFADIQQRLDQILDEVNDSETSLDRALALCEEAVSLGLSASSLLEDDVAQEELEQQEPQESQTASRPEPGQDAVAE